MLCDTALQCKQASKAGGVGCAEAVQEVWCVMVGTHSTSGHCVFFSLIIAGSVMLLRTYSLLLMVWANSWLYAQGKRCGPLTCSKS